jgi:hypothetical protein
MGNCFFTSAPVIVHIRPGVSLLVCCTTGLWISRGSVRSNEDRLNNSQVAVQPNHMPLPVLAYLLFVVCATWFSPVYLGLWAVAVPNMEILSLWVVKFVARRLSKIHSTICISPYTALGMMTSTNVPRRSTLGRLKSASLTLLGIKPPSKLDTPGQYCNPTIL